ncbi:MAG: pilus assembly protein PilP [Sulfurimonas sp.]|nr:pilus assembly protein PilP [Sulfurimonas sp.]
MTRRKSNCIPNILILVVSLIVAGCAKEEKTNPPPAVSKPAKSATSASAPVQMGLSSSRNGAALAVQKQSSSLRHVLPPETILDFSRKKDPFKPFITLPTPVKHVGRKPAGDMLPIQRYDVNKFRLVGIIAGLKENRALIIDPLGKGYVVKVGMSVGSNQGKIVRITASAVEVLEQFSDDNGKIRKRTVRLTLSQKGKESVR